MSRVLAIQHSTFDGLYEVERALRDFESDIDLRGVHKGDPLPDTVSHYDGFVVLGGPQSAYSDENFSTREAELSLIREAVEESIPTLGLCLGAQLMAHACGGKAKVGDAPEIGWLPVYLTDDAMDDPLLADLPDEFSPLHWHGDTYEAPTNAVHLAYSDAYLQQAFRLGPCAWGFQFHLEVDEFAVDAFCRDSPDQAEKAAGGAAKIISDTPDAALAITTLRDTVFDRFADIVLDYAASRSAAAVRAD